jgi:four helix bundle protein
MGTVGDGKMLPVPLLHPTLRHDRIDEHQPAGPVLRDLIVWQRAMELAEESVLLADGLAVGKLRGLRDQIQRSAASIPANIAEGNGRQRLGDYLRYLSMANGSLMDLQTHLELAARLHLVTEPQLAKARGLSEEVSKMLRALIRALERRRA